jgi:single-strand DNA-binding protein
MEKSLNKVELKGNVGFDPRISVYDEGAVVMRLSLATNESYKNKKGEFVEDTVWHNVIAWAGKGMPDFSKIKKGTFLSVTGRIKPVQYQTKTGADKHSYEIVAYSIKLPSDEGE